MRIAFLFNHYDVHQVPHTAPFAFALSKRPGVEVDILASCDAQLEFARQLGAVHPGGHSVRFERLRAPGWARAVDRVLSRWVFVRKEATLRANAGRLGRYDAVVSPERTAMRLATRYGQTGPCFVRVMHGAGDRAIASPMGKGGGQGDCASLLLVPGRKHVERYGGQTSASVAAVGSAKFEAVRALSPEPPTLFADSRPVVLYNPHFCARVSSWPGMGRNVLEWFRNQSEFNLIFAPHVVMWRRARRHKASLPTWARNPPPHIHIDTGSAASCDMSYVRAADIYLGDASSQVYEFLQAPRPCVFLDGHDTPWRGCAHHAHWNFGRVVESVADMGEALRKAQATHARYLPGQRAGMAHAFAEGLSGDGATVAERGADAVEAHLREVMAAKRAARVEAAAVVLPTGASPVR